MLAIVLSAGLVLSEFLAYRAVRVQSSMGVDSEVAFLEQRKVVVHLNVTFHKIPCDLLNFDANDVMGNRDVEAKGNLFKQPVEKDGNVTISAQQDVDSSSPHARLVPMNFQFAWTGGNFHVGGYPTFDAETVKQKLGVEGCRLWGSVTVNRAPGNLHVSGGYLYGVKTQATHTIHQFSFGETVTEIPAEMADAITPLDGTVSDPSQQQGLSKVYEYFLKVVPSRFRKLSGETWKFFQFSVAENTASNGFMSSVYFRYDFAPVVVEWKETSESIVQFAVRVLSIVGGLVGVIGLLHAVIVDSVETIRRKKAQLDKLR